MTSKKSAKKKKSKKSAPKGKIAKKTIAKKKPAASKRSRVKIVRRRRSSSVRLDDGLNERRVLADLPSPDDQGLSRSAGADSESVDELLDEGNAFEAGVVSGVEEADQSEEREVRTREVPEDDVPDEYLDNES